MTDASFVHSKPHQPGEFALPNSLRRRVYLGLRWFAAPRAFTSGPPDPRLRERENHSANRWQKASKVKFAASKIRGRISVAS
ncbi:conserved hypothetical protein [Nitrosococcus watsonii C-113]|uniref:Uncharacterized protein n=1 Tax=Nitrosococcus watsoni (strain C-113) TaxID=105559 RepID=D8K6A0_NITWC|nr:conserved hypothetical protein [Nitrosococcus watsonii C-113]